jgi:hypothetical protein
VSSKQKAAATPEKLTTVLANDPEDRKGRLKAIGGSPSDHWNNVLANQTMSALWLKHSDEATRDRQYGATVAGLADIGPRDELYTGGGDRQKLEDQPHAKQIAHAPEPTLWSSNETRRQMPSASDVEWPVPAAPRKVDGSSNGQ